MSLINIVNEQDEVIGSKERADVVREDIYRVSALWLRDSQGRVLLAQRALTKKHDSGKWGPAVAGTVEAGETYLENIRKEMDEELGITDLDITEGPKMRRMAGVDGEHNYFVQWFFGTLDWPAASFRIPPAEVAAVRWFSPDELREALATHPQDFLGRMGSYAQTLMV